jgi:predicted glycosyltransferase
MYYSKAIVSSGDSIAREGALLGVPSIYCGQRKMTANSVLCRKGMLFLKRPRDVPAFLNEIINGKVCVREQHQFRQNLMNEWDDATELVVERVKAFTK